MPNQELTFEQELQLEEHHKRVRNRIVGLVVLLLLIAFGFYVYHRLQNKGRASYPEARDSTKIVYLVDEPQPSTAQMYVAKTMQSTPPRFSTVIFITTQPDSFPAHDRYGSDITYLTAPNESSAVARAVQLAQENWPQAKNRYLYFSFSPSHDIDSVMNLLIRNDIFTGRMALPLVRPNK